MRSDIGSMPLMCILSLITSNVYAYLPTDDLTNSILAPGNGGFPPDAIVPDVDASSSIPDDETDEGVDSIYRGAAKKVSTFRRRNINSPYGGRVPFSRMAYKSGYGSSIGRGGIGGGGGGGYATRSGNIGGAGFYERNPYGNVNLGQSGYGSQPHPEEYAIRPSAPYSGLIGGSRAGYYGSTVGLRNRPTASARKIDYPSEYAPANDLMGSFNNNNQGQLPSLRELASYASRYGPAYLRERFGGQEDGRVPVPYNGLHIPRGGGGSTDFGLSMANNQWQGGHGPNGIMTRDMDSYQHDDTSKKTSSTSTTTTQKPKRMKKRRTTTTTSKPV